jgi:hypothetical protein
MTGYPYLLTTLSHTWPRAPLPNDVRSRGRAV